MATSLVSAFKGVSIHHSIKSAVVAKKAEGQKRKEVAPIQAVASTLRPKTGMRPSLLRSAKKSKPALLLSKRKNLRKLASVSAPSKNSAVKTISPKPIAPPPRESFEGLKKPGKPVAFKASPELEDKYASFEGLKRPPPKSTTTARPAGRRSTSYTPSSSTNAGVLIVGAGGKTGLALTEALGEKGLPVKTLYNKMEASQFELAKAVLGNSEVVVWTTEDSPDIFDPLGPYQEFEALNNLVAAAKLSGSVKKFVLITSLGVSNILLPVNLFYGVLLWKKQAELALQRSGLDYTIIRPGLATVSDSASSNVVIKGEDSFFSGYASRYHVAEVVAEVLNNPATTNQILEVVSRESAPQKSIAEQIGSL